MALHTGKLNGIAVCAGNGGLELGLKLALGEQYKTVCYVEREAYNARTLVARMDDSLLDQAPIWDDITTFDGKPWRGLVDIISAGFPCQPHSQAGLQKGIADERWIWDSIERTGRDILPGIFWLENVPNLAFSGLDRVISSLSKAGYNSIWKTFSAEETGASQKRERLFILSYANGFFDRNKQAERQAWRNFVSGSYWQNLSELACANGIGLEEKPGRTESLCGIDVGQSENQCSKTEESSRSLAQSFGERRRETRENGNLKSGEFGQSSKTLGTPIRLGAETFVFPPFRNDYDGWREYLSARPDLEPAVLRSLNGTPNKLDRLRTIGNGVVPLVAAYAFVSLMRTAIRINL